MSMCVLSPGAFRDRVALEIWLIDHGIKPEHVASVERLVVRPHWNYALVVFPWTEDFGQLMVRVKLEQNEIARYTGTAFDETWQVAILVPCGYCRAHAGDWCVKPDGRPLARTEAPHMGRIDDGKRDAWYRERLDAEDRGQDAESQDVSVGPGPPQD